MALKRFHGMNIGRGEPINIAVKSWGDPADVYHNPGMLFEFSISGESTAGRKPPNTEDLEDYYRVISCVNQHKIAKQMS
jgi:hypothetical protein